MIISKVPEGPGPYPDKITIGLQLLERHPSGKILVKRLAIAGCEVPAPKLTVRVEAVQEFRGARFET